MNLPSITWSVCPVTLFGSNFEKEACSGAVCICISS